MLLALEQQRKLTNKESLELYELDAALQPMGFRRTFRDPIYSAFLQKLFKKNIKEYNDFKNLSKVDKDNIINEIITELSEED